MPWAVAGGAISAAGTIGGGLMQSSTAANAQKQANWQRQLAVLQSQQNYNQNVQNLAPYSGTGTQASGAEAGLLGLNGPDAASAAMANFTTSPDYQWRLGEGLRGVDAAGAAGRLLPGVRSGATMKAEMDYAQGLAGQEFGNYFTRLNQLAGRGFDATTGLDQAGNNLTNAILGVGSSAISGATGAANAQNSITGNMASSLGTTLGGVLQNKNVQSTLSGLFGGGTNSLANYGASPSDYQTAPGFNIGTDISAPSYWPGMPGGATYSG